MPFRPGPLSQSDAARLNELERAVQALAKMTAAPPLSVRRVVGIPLLSLDTAGLGGGGVDYWFAELTSSSSPFSWKERVEASAGTWADGSRSGTSNAYQAYPGTTGGGINPQTPGAGHIVLMRASDTVSNKYEFVVTDLPPAAVRIFPGGSSTALATNGTTNITGISLPVGKWLVMYDMTARIGTNTAGDLIYADLAITSGTGTLDTAALAYVAVVEVANVTNLRTAHGMSTVTMTTAGTVHVRATRAASGTVTVAEVFPPYTRLAAVRVFF